jgi:hypothetical protein
MLMIIYANKFGRKRKYEINTKVTTTGQVRRKLYMHACAISDQFYTLLYYIDIF